MRTSMVRGTLATLVAAMSLLMPARSEAACRLWDCLFGTTTAPSQTTYAPPYAAPASSYAPAYVPAAAPAYGSCAPACATTCVPSCGATCEPACPQMVVPSCGSCVPQTCQYMAAAPAYTAVSYRPVFGGGSRWIPYSTYRLEYAPSVAYTTYNPYSTAYYVGGAATYASPCTSCVSPVGSCATCTTGCASGACGLSGYGESATGCSSCTVPSLPSPTAAPLPSDALPSTGAAPAGPGANPAATPTPAEPQPKTFQDKKAPVEKQEGPALNTPTDSNVNPTSTPQRDGGSDRTAMRATRQPIRVEMTAMPARQETLNENAGWEASKN